MDDAPSAGLVLAIAALRRDLAAHTIGFSASDVHSQALAGALAEVEKIYLDSMGRSAGVTPTAGVGEGTGGHLRRVCRYAMKLTGLVAPDHVSDPQFEYGFLLHDIGMLTVPGSVSASPGAMTDDEWEVMKRHPETGASLLRHIPFLAGADEIILAHHERWNGKGYPKGLVGEEIPVGARILALCDAFNAITQNRPYRKASTIADARGEIYLGSKGQFWPAAVHAFLDLSVAELEAIREPWLNGANPVPIPTARLGPSNTWNPRRAPGPVPGRSGR